MKLKIYSKPERTSSTKPFISITKKGLIRLNPPSVDKLGVKVGETVEFANDEEKPSDWFIRKSNDENSFVLRSNKANRGLLFNSVFIKETIEKSLGTEITQSIKLPVGEQIEGGFFTLITRFATK